MSNILKLIEEIIDIVNRPQSGKYSLIDTKWWEYFIKTYEIMKANPNNMNIQQ